jgi:hypothetical protein
MSRGFGEYSSSGRAVRAVHTLARHRRIKGVTLIRLTDSVRCHIRAAIKNARADYIGAGRASAKPLSRPLLFLHDIRGQRVMSVDRLLAAVLFGPGSL